jgi:SPASM domain peptide maturase of grasp-with-spasm system
MTGKTYIRLFANCIVSQGAKHSIIIDLQNSEYIYIPNSMAAILKKYRNHSIEEIQVEFLEDQNKILTEYFEFLVNNNLGAFISEELLPCFPELSKKWESPCQISNAIYDYSHETRPYLEKFLADLQTMQCPAIEIRVFYVISPDNLYSLINLLLKSQMRVTIFYIKFNSEFDFNDITTKLKLAAGYLDLIFFDCPIDYKYNDDVNEIQICTRKDILSEKSCGFISKDFFAINIKTYVESQNYNTCLHRKISVDQAGNIKNCPSMSETFGHIEKSSIIEIITSEKFQKLWTIKKSQISICKDCEFKHVCTDCRAYLQEPENIYSKPLKCGYDPYTGVWEDWSTNPLSKTAITYYGLKEIL